MTAGSAEPKGPVRAAEPGGPKEPLPPVPVPPRRRGRRLRRQPPAEPPLKAQLRLRSPAGAFVLLGVCVVLVGMTIAVVGYWPHRAHGPAASAGNASAAGDARREGAAGHLVPHSEKLKLIGPVIMGIGLFIFICANTMLYENRDTETRQLMQKGLFGLAAGLPERRGAEDGRCPRGDGQPFPAASAECLEGCYRVDLSCQPCPGPSSKRSGCCGPSRLPSGAGCPQRPAASPAASPLSGAGAASLLSAAVGALALPLIKLNNCLLDGAARGAGGGPAEHPPAAPALCRAPPSPGDSAAPCGRGAAGDGDRDGDGDRGHVAISMDDSCPGAELLLELSPDVHLHTPGHSKSLDLGQPGVLLLAPIKDRENRSWPRLDRVSLVGYARLESAGESAERLLEPPGRGEPRASAWVVGVQQGTRV